MRAKSPSSRAVFGFPVFPLPARFSIFQSRSRFTPKRSTVSQTNCTNSQIIKSIRSKSKNNNDSIISAMMSAAATPIQQQPSSAFHQKHLHHHHHSAAIDRIIDSPVAKHAEQDDIRQALWQPVIELDVHTVLANHALPKDVRRRDIAVSTDVQLEPPPPPPPLRCHRSHH